MTCSTPGCYAKSFRRNLCRAHFYMWDDVLSSKGPGLTRKEPSDVRPAPLSLREPSAPWCLCETPVVGVIALFTRTYREREPRPGDMVECRECGMPIKEHLDVAR